MVDFCQTEDRLPNLISEACITSEPEFANSLFHVSVT